jgi:hypothetical protein
MAAETPRRVDLRRLRDDGAGQAPGKIHGNRECAPTRRTLDTG